MIAIEQFATFGELTISWVGGEHAALDADLVDVYDG
jgi:hypothetical protein